MAEERKRVLLVDDHELARQGLRRMLELEEDMEVVGEASSVEEALEQVATLSPDIVLMDIKMPTSNGLEATRQLKERGLAGEVIILSLYDEYLAQAIEAGAGGYLVKDVKREELASAIRRVHKGEMVLGTSILASPTSIEAALRRFQEVTRGRAEGESQRPVGAMTPGSQAWAPSPDEAHTTGEGHHPSHRPDPTAVQARALPVVPGPESNGGPTFPYASVQQAAVGPTHDAREVAPATDVAGEGAATLPEVWEDTLTGEDLEEAPPQAQKPNGYNEEAELVIPPPVDVHRLLLLSRRLRERYHVEIMETVGSWEGGTWMKLMLRKPIALKEVLAQMPEVIQVWEATPEDRDSPVRVGAMATNAAIPGPWLRLVVRITGDAEQLTFAI